MRLLFSVLSLSFVIGAQLGAALAQTATPAAPGASLAVPQDFTKRELLIGTKEAAPFAIKAADGTWSGISIDLWRRIADRLGVTYRFQEETLKGLIDKTAAGELDGAIAAITVTAAREQVLDFSQPFYATGLGIAVRSEVQSGWWSLLRGLFSLGFLQAVLALAAVLLAIGLLIWAVERRRNPQFGGNTAKGVGAGFWWSAVTMTTVGYGDKAPVTLAGRLIAIAWMFASIIVISGFTAGITTALTTSQLQGLVRDVGDLPSVRVGTVAGSSSVDYLTRERISFKPFASAAEGLSAVKSGDLDAFVYDRPLLQWMVKKTFSHEVRVLMSVFDDQTYAIALPNGSPLREPIDRALLEAVRSGWWKDNVYHYLGEKT